MKMRAHGSSWLLYFIDHSQFATSDEYTARYGNADLQEAVSVIM